MSFVHVDRNYAKSEINCVQYEVNCVNVEQNCLNAEKNDVNAVKSLENVGTLTILQPFKALIYKKQRDLAGV
jgi:hypothetical protein